ncbi:UDP-N-acetylglucosamine:LPS N-acetylglucosamine transferase [Bacillus pakistanensis]|uniref:UDP-N-acetylglucosamine:LPS N-acetylglucosamine transferase n=1 Tax=Rossellomorea pakistanensis TaxID=992288 RepID=A0ABS2N7B1_9BACI|nr:glycosyltransferase [Bacillus pakistanensis]MBM7583743.1 UDP-N-acetylglucosamine:LPS N-acetylglucosamine transferase [Bacillus pakistanensis]
MKKILFFPLLRMPSGHHQVADAISGYLKSRNSEIICKKIDLLSEWNPMMESFITKTYLKWIHHFPRNYAWVYKQMAYKSSSNRSYKYYEFLFLKKMKRIICEETPDLIICTHAFPSYFLSRLKMQNQCKIPVINIYTDFFINDVWGREGVDYHFVPSKTTKMELLKKEGISEDQVFVTGIPTDEHFDEVLNIEKKNSSCHVLISGGSIGLGNISDLLKQNKDSEVEYFVLCGKNKKLYQKLKKLNCKNIHPLSYISSRERMNELYSKADAIITKPGGVTISEALKKGLPIFIHSALPGQEEINLKILNELKLVNELNDQQLLEDQITGFFRNKLLTDQFNESIYAYLNDIKAGKAADISKFIRCLIDRDDKTELKRDFIRLDQEII